MGWVGGWDGEGDEMSRGMGWRDGMVEGIGW